MVPAWLHDLAIVSLAVAVACAAVIAADIALGRRQTMWIMHLVWPITALWSGPLGLWAYFRWGRAATRRAAREAEQAGQDPPTGRQPFPVKVAKAATHCGSGCTLGDLAAEWLILAVPLTVFGKHIFGAWVYDFVLAFLFGIVFQYFTIAPMRHLPVGEGIAAALKADTLSLTSWQLGMYGWMAIATFAVFGHELSKTEPVFWLMMQIGMGLGFVTSYPVNWWLLRRGLKEEM